MNSLVNDKNDGSFSESFMGESHILAFIIGAIKKYEWSKALVNVEKA